MFSIKETITWTKAALRRNYVLLAKVSLINVIPVVGLYVFENMGTATGEMLAAVTTIIGIGLSYMILAATNYVAATAVTGGDVSSREILNQSKKTVVQVIVVGLLTTCYVLAFLPTIIGPVIAVLFTVLSTAVFFVEGKRGIDAVATSVGYVRSSVWGIMGYGVLVAMVAFIPVIVVAALVGGGSGESEPTSLADVSINLFTHIWTIPIGTMAMYAAYRSAKEAAPEISPEKYAKRRRFTKMCAIAGPVIFAALLLFVWVFAS